MQRTKASEDQEPRVTLRLVKVGLHDEYVEEHAAEPRLTSPNQE